MTKEKSTLASVIDEFRSLGFAAFSYPKKGAVSISGFPAIPERQAIKKMREMIQKSKAERGSA